MVMAEYGTIKRIASMVVDSVLDGGYDLRIQRPQFDRGGSEHPPQRTCYYTGCVWLASGYA